MRQGKRHCAPPPPNLGQPKIQAESLEKFGQKCCAVSPPPTEKSKTLTTGVKTCSGLSWVKAFVNVSTNKKVETTKQTIPNSAPRPNQADTNRGHNWPRRMKMRLKRVVYHRKWPIMTWKPHLSCCWTYCWRKGALVCRKWFKEICFFFFCILCILFKQLMCSYIIIYAFIGNNFNGLHGGIQSVGSIVVNQVTVCDVILLRTSSAFLFLSRNW